METKPKVENKMDVAALGAAPQLPAGIVNGMALDKRLTVLPYKMKQEKEIAKLRRPGSPVSEYVLTLLGLLVNRFGPHEIQSMDMAARKLIFTSSFVSDVLYAYMYIRLDSMGSDFPLNMQCPSCRHRQLVTGNLSTLEIRIVKDQKQLSWPLSLRDGMKINGAVRKEITLQPPVWGSLDAGNFNEERNKELSVIRASLLKAEGVDGPPVLLDDDADDMSKWDLELIQRSIEDNSPGPRFVVEAKCGKCAGEMLGLVDWSDPSFFSMPSPQPTTRS